MVKESKIQYFAVVYSKPEYKNSIHLLPCPTKEACLEKLKEMRDDPKAGKRILATTVIKRDMSNFKDNLIFGNPKSLDVMQMKESKKHE